MQGQGAPAPGSQMIVHGGVPYQVPPGQSWYWTVAQTAGPPSEDDKEKAFYAHLFPAIASLLCLGAAIHIALPLIARQMTPSKHPFLLFHVNQSLMFHGGLFVANIVLGIIFYIVAIVTCGVGGFLFLINLSIPFVSCFYGLYLAFRAKDGAWDQYLLAGSKVWSMNKPMVT